MSGPFLNFFFNKGHKGRSMCEDGRLWVQTGQCVARGVYCEG